MNDPSQPSGGTGNGDINGQPPPQKQSTRLNQATVTDGGTLPFMPPPMRPGNPSSAGTVPFKLNGGSK